VLPAFLEFARDAVLVAHNAPFDIAFLKAAAEQTGTLWPRFAVVDTAHLARQLVSSDEAPNRKLSSLARLFRATTTPDHRALHDARATVDVLHALLARVGNLGVVTLEELATFSARVTGAQRRKRYLAEALPNAPGVYLFKDARGSVLYVGTSKDIRTRVRTYFTASEQRARMAEMVALAQSVTAVVCQTPLEAEVRELRLIAEHKPRYNRRSRFPERLLWVKLTVEAFPRLSIVRAVRDDGARYFGPFSSQQGAQAAVAAVHEVIPLRQCTTKLSTNAHGSPCILADLGRCGAPCTGAQDTAGYSRVVADAVRLLSGDARSGVAALHSRMDQLAGQERYEEAQTVRDRMMALVRAAARAQRLAPLARSPELVAARHAPTGGWEVVCVRHGRLAGTTVSARGADPMPYIDALVRSAEVVLPAAGPEPSASAEETEKVLRWLEAPGVRLVYLRGEWTCPVHGAGAARARLDPLTASHRDVVGFDEPEAPGRRRPSRGAAPAARTPPPSVPGARVSA